ncbi:MAG: hypothetical protein WD037_01755 [Balneolales bacterium]
MKRILLLPALLLLMCSSVSGQVTISPTTLFIDDQSRFGTFLVMNSSDQAQEVSLSFQFGYPGTDETGRSVMRYDDDEAASRHSIADWIRGFPRNFILEPGQRQTVRLTVRPPEQIEDGVYWTRIKTTSNPLSADVEEQAGEGISAQINFNFEQVTSGFYKQGSVNTGIVFEDLAVEQNGESAYVVADLVRSGNAPFLGSMQLLIRNSSGNTVEEFRSSTTMYFDGLKRMNFDITDWPAGEYTAEMRFESRRSDIPSTDLVQMDSVSSEVRFTVAP